MRTGGLEMLRFSKDEVLKKIGSVKHWYHRIEVYPGILTPGINDCQTTLKLMKIPSDCRGMKVLDIGARDGFFSFEFEKRGALVTAIDYVGKKDTGFAVAAEILDSKVDFRQDNIFNISREKYGTYDIVLCLGLLYHLRDPMAALDICRSVCTNEFYLETQIIDEAFLKNDGNLVSIKSIAPILKDIPVMQFYPGNSLNNDYSNYWAPNFICMEKMLIECGFTPVDKINRGTRAIFKSRIYDDTKVAYYRDIAKGTACPPSESMWDGESKKRR